MSLDFENGFEIKLKRHAKKLWSHNDGDPSSVEEATLQWLSQYGVEGYFTEKIAVKEILGIVIGWPTKFRPFPRQLHRLEGLFFMGADHPYKFHKFTSKEVANHFHNFDDKDLYSRLLEFKAAGIKHKIFCRDSSALDINKLHRFYRVFGKERLTEVIFPTKVPSYATLDLIAWDQHGLLELEVKAPNDRLKSHQTKQIAYAKSLGVRSCVVTVLESN